MRAISEIGSRVTIGCLLFLAVLGSPWQGKASLTEYDATINADATNGLPTVAKLSAAIVFTGANRANFNFGANSGDVTIEFIVEGNPAASTGAAVLGVGTNSSSHLRYEQWQNTGQLGFTQLGVLDYVFTPGIPSPSAPSHVVYVWNAGTRVMKLYLNGSLAGTRSGVSTSFAMPTGIGYLGANNSNTENLYGTIHRVTVYDDIIADEAIQRHSDAYFDVIRPPVVVSFTAAPNALFGGGSSTLSWNVQRATRVEINGMDVTGVSNLVVTPSSTTTYILTASNAASVANAQVTVLVDPAPIVRSFSATRTYVVPGETTTLRWHTLYGQAYEIQPGIGDVTGNTIDDFGSIDVQPINPTTYTFTARNVNGTNTATVNINILNPANHLVISEFMADNEGSLADENGDYPSWIEIYNPTPAPVSLQGYYLTDDSGDPTKWAFPNLTMPAKSFLLVFASGKNRATPSAPLHTNFELRNEGEYLALIGPGGTVLHAFAPVFPPQRPNIGYGILGGDITIERYMGTPSPGTNNVESIPAPAEVTFNHPSRTFTGPLQVELACPTPGAEIRYTTNGSEPGISNGIVYTAAFTVTNTTRLRAAAIASGQRSRITGASYIKLSAELASYTSTLPIMVIDNFGAGVIPQKGWTTTGAGVKQVPRQNAVWATFDRVSGASSLTNKPQMISLTGIRGRGAFSSQWRQKPYSVEAINEEGEEREVDPLGMPSHPDWVLYFPDPDDNKDPTLMFNTFVYDLCRQLGKYSVRFRWVEAFVNEDGGELGMADRRGVYAIVEKVSRGSDRLDFQRQSADGTNGGWLLNLNRMDPEPETGWPSANGATQPWFFHTPGPNRILESPPNDFVRGDDEPQQSNGYLNFDNPSGYVINPNQRAAIENWFKQFEDVLWNNAVWRDPINGYRKYLDPVDFADYFVFNVLTKNGDGLLISMFPWKGDDGKLRMGPPWDYNWSPYYIAGSPTDALMHRSDRLWYRRLFADPDFYQLYIDRWWDHRRSAMSNEGMDAVIDGQMAEITPAKAMLNGLTSAGQWNDRLTQMKTWLKTRADFIDRTFVRPPVFNHPGGEVPEGFQLAMTGTNGILYYTMDGTDPRAPGGAVHPAAQSYAAGIPILGQATAVARIKNGTNWSGLTRAIFHTPQDLRHLVLTEIMYNPPASGGWTSDDLEYLELKNTGTNALELGTFTFGEGINFSFTNGTRLLPGQYFILARNAVAFASKYPGVQPNGIYTGRLDNGGETLRLETVEGNTIWAVTYNDRSPWPLAADGYGFAVTAQDPIRWPNSDNGLRWRASANPGGSPGADDPPGAIAPILINEVLTHTDLPDVDAIELFNPTAQEVNLGGWFLTDEGGAPKKFRIPDGTTISPGGYLVFTEEDFNPTPQTALNFALDSGGDSLYLVSADSSTNLTGYSHAISFDAAANGVSFGRYVNSVGDEQFPAQTAVTLESGNAGPRVGPVVIQEIMYHPLESDDEFVEIANISAESVALFDQSHTSNTWRINGLGYTFPTNITIPSGGLLLIVSTNPADFRLKYNVPSDAQVLGPFDGTLQNDGERLQLQRPDAPDTNGLFAYITVDEVRYNDKLPWPPGADGGGPSLQRRAPSVYGNDPINWEAAPATPGRAFVPGDPPAITGQPQSQTVVAYQDVQMSVTAVGAGPLSYQWLFNGSVIDHGTNSVLVLTNVQPQQAGIYKTVVFNSAGSATSADAQLSLLYPPVIQQQPRSVSTNSGRTVVFSVSAFGSGPLRYQWRRDGFPLTDATNATLTLTNVQSTHAGQYTVVVSDPVGPVTSAPALLVVMIEPLIVQHPLSQQVSTGGTVVLSVTVTNTATLPIGYLWRTNNRFAYTNILHQRTAFLTITNARAPYTNYAVVVTNIAKPSGNISSTAFLTLIPDTDQDGLPDAWEDLYLFDKNNPTDRNGDADGDSMLNWQEYVAGTDPRDDSSFLKIEITPGVGATVSFLAASNKTYAIEFTDNFSSWSPLFDIAARNTTRVEQRNDSQGTTNRYYRLVTPRY